MKTISLTISFFSVLLLCAQSFAQIPILKDYNSPVPKVVTPARVTRDGGVPAPSDAISLFNGNDLSEWTGSKGAPEWTVHDGMFTVVEKTGDLNTKKEFGDFQLHIE